MLKQEKELRGQTQALTWTAEAESKRDWKETDGANSLFKRSISSNTVYV